MSRPEFSAIRDEFGYRGSQIRKMGTVDGCGLADFLLITVSQAFVVLCSSIKAPGPPGFMAAELDKFLVHYIEHATEEGKFLTEVGVSRATLRSCRQERTVKLTSCDSRLQLGELVAQDQIRFGVSLISDP